MESVFELLGDSQPGGSETFWVFKRFHIIFSGFVELYRIFMGCRGFDSVSIGAFQCYLCLEGLTGGKGISFGFAGLV